MKAHYKLFLSLAIGSFVTFAGCQDDEVVDLVKYPVNQPAITIDDAEGASKATLTAVYKSDGTLELDGPVTRTYTFHFAASPEDATVTFDIINTNIPKENVEISATKVVLPAGSTDASVTVTLKDEDFSFAASNYDATTYELGVKASVEGYKIGTEPIESKVVIEKEAYTASCSVVGESGNNVTFERAFSQGAIVNPDPISYTFKMKLDKPARKDVKVKLATTGLDEQFMKNITVTPAEITIAAGELESAEVTWTITDDFLLTTAGEESHTLVVTASAESEDPVVKVNSKENFLTFNVDKVLRKTLALVSTTYGGKQAPKNRELIDIYKYGIISHGRVLTQNDIASFCKKELGELLLRTEIRNGVEISPVPTEGLIRTKEVHLVLGTKLDGPSQEKQMKDSLHTRLSACSPDTFNYRIFIEYNNA